MNVRLRMTHFELSWSRQSSTQTRQ